MVSTVDLAHYYSKLIYIPVKNEVKCGPVSQSVRRRRRECSVYNNNIIYRVTEGALVVKIGIYNHHHQAATAAEVVKSSSG